MIKLKVKMYLDETELQKVVQKEMYSIISYGIENFLRPITPVKTGRLQASEDAIIIDTAKYKAVVSIIAEDYFKFVQARRGFANFFIDYLGGENVPTGEKGNYAIEE